MCSIVGFIARTDSGPNLFHIRQAVEANLCRGEDAHGMAWADANGRVHVYKRPGTFKDNMHVLNAIQGARAVIIHMRKTTQGSEKDNINNHPHPCDGGWFIHNGMIYNYSELLVQWGLMPSSECDTEVLGLITSRVNRGRLHQWEKAINEVETRAPLAIMAIYSNPVRLVVARRGNPLSYWNHNTGIYFASLGAGFPHRGKEFRDNQAVEYKWTRQKGGGRTSSILLKAYAPPRYVYDCDDYVTGSCTVQRGGRSTVSKGTGYCGSTLTPAERALLDAQYGGDNGEVHEYFSGRDGVTTTEYLPAKYRMEMIQRAATAGKSKGQLPLLENLDKDERTIVKGAFDRKGNPVMVQDEAGVDDLDEVDYHICPKCEAVLLKKPRQDGTVCDCPSDMVAFHIGIADDDDPPSPDDALAHVVSDVDAADLIDRSQGG